MKVGGNCLEQDKQYSYGLKPAPASLGFIVFGGFAVFMMITALQNRGRLVIDGVIELSPSGATSFYWLVALFCAGLAAFAAVQFFAALRPPGALVLAKDEIRVPRLGLFPESNIPLASITGLSLEKVRGQPFVLIRHREGKREIKRLFFSDPVHFDDFARLLASRLDSTQRKSE